MCKSQKLSKTQQWQDAVDMIDPFYGDPDQLSALIKSAPTARERRWLKGCIQQTQILRDQFQRLAQ